MPAPPTAPLAAFRCALVEDDAAYAAVVRYTLARCGATEIAVYDRGEALLDALSKGGRSGRRAALPHLVVLDLMMPGIGGIETLRALMAAHPGLAVVVASAQTEMAVALEAMKLGAFDYVTKGQDDLVRIGAAGRRVAEHERLRAHVSALHARLGLFDHDAPAMTGDSAAMEHVYRLVEKALRGDLTVAIVGESGTGKELVARAIHYASPRKRGPFVVVNCAAIPRDLMESEFFGHEKGSFTGATGRKIGKFEAADGGTIFLDEIGEMDLDLQAKLLRALQSREIVRVGGSETVSFDARVISATNRDVAQMIREGRFREDLYYRLYQYPIPIPPLREREGDVPVLAERFRADFLARYPDVAPRVFSRAALRVVASYPWPGNVRELKSATERALLLADGAEIEPADLMLPGHEGPAAASPLPSGTPHPSAPPAPADVIPLDEVKRRAAEHALAAFGGNVQRAASALGITRATLYRYTARPAADGVDVPTGEPI